MKQFRMFSKTLLLIPNYKNFYNWTDLNWALLTKMNRIFRVFRDLKF